MISKTDDLFHKRARIMLSQRFPWLGTFEEVNSSDMVDELCDLFEGLGDLILMRKLQKQKTDATKKSVKKTAKKARKK